MSDTFKLFVYGTQKRGGSRAYVLRGQHLLRDAVTTPHYKLFDLGLYPGMVRVENDGRRVHGELYEVRNGLKSLLDQMEPGLFRLERVEVEEETGPVYSYLFKVRLKNPTIIESNRWEAGR
jgi:gamma-glutamylcyclotransferase (GGCT)/AIG2-like uncharacterized protein YtfP